MPIPEPPAALAGLSLAELAKLADGMRAPPVEKWHPTHCGDSAMRIARDGIWYHEGSPIGRPAMVRLFSSILRREPDGGFVLVTPVEKLAIEVEDAPFVAVELNASEGNLAFRLNTGDVVIAGPNHPLRFEERADGPHPYVRVRGGLDALIARPLYYELAEMALAAGDEPPGVRSGGAFFAIGSAE